MAKVEHSKQQGPASVDGSSEKQQLVVLLMKGHPGSGKSSLARQLAMRLHWPVIDKDDSKDVLMTQPGCSEERHANALSYAIMLRTAATQLAIGLSVVLDCPLARLELYRRAAVVAAQAKARTVVVDCCCKDKSVWQQRLEARAMLDAGTDRAHKPQDWRDIEALLERYNGEDRWLERGEPGVESLVVDTSQGTTAEAAERVLAHMRSSGLLATPCLAADDPLFLNSG